jgi:TolA-binding protein
VTSCNLENNRLKKELSKFARDHISLKQGFGIISEENEQLKANKEMEQGFRQVSGSERQPIDLIADAKTEAKEASETSKKVDADQVAEVESIKSRPCTKAGKNSNNNCWSSNAK